MVAAARSLPSASDDRVHAVRRFNRFYTRQIGVLHEHLLASEFSLTEVRVLYELAHRENATAVELCKDLGLDAGYLSRMLRGFEKRKLVSRSVSPSDARSSWLTLTPRGRQVFTPLEARSDQEVAAMLARLTSVQQGSLLAAMRTIEETLGEKQSSATPYLIRTHQPGDMGWMTHRHGVLYSQEYGYDERFEALVAEIVAGFIQNFDPRHERCWIAEKDGEIVGSIFLVKKSKTVSKLRLLLVEPAARGLGIGKRLVEECIRFAKQAGYKKVVLWTQIELHAARHLYEQAGFKLIEEKPHESWGRKDLVAEVWELKL